MESTYVVPAGKPAHDGRLKRRYMEGPPIVVTGAPAPVAFIESGWIGETLRYENSSIGSQDIGYAYDSTRWKLFERHSASISREKRLVSGLTRLRSGRPSESADAFTRHGDLRTNTLLTFEDGENA